MASFRQLRVYRTSVSIGYALIFVHNILRLFSMQHVTLEGTPPTHTHTHRVEGAAVFLKEMFFSAFSCLPR